MSFIQIEIIEKNVLEASEKLCSFYRNNFIIRRNFDEFFRNMLRISN